MKNEDRASEYICDECGKGMGAPAVFITPGDFCNGCIDKLVKIGRDSARGTRTPTLTWSTLVLTIGKMSGDLVNTPIQLWLPPGRCWKEEGVKVGVRFEEAWFATDLPHLRLDDRT